MRHYEPAAPVAACNGCPAVVKDGESVLCVEQWRVVSSQLMVQVTEGDWNAVVTTARKGMFLIRRRDGLSTEACPLLKYDIRHIAREFSPGQETGALGSGQSRGRIERNRR